MACAAVSSRTTLRGQAESWLAGWPNSVDLSSHPALGGTPDEFVQLQLKPDVEPVS
jgi:hypothetical protein